MTNRPHISSASTFADRFAVARDARSAALARRRRRAPRTGRRPGSTPHMRGCRRSARARASRTAAGRRRSRAARACSPARSSRTAIVVSVDLEGAVRALRADDGQPVWQASLRLGGAGDAGDGARAGVRSDGRQQAWWRCGSPTAAKLWTRDVGGMTLSSPTPINGDLIVAAGFPQRHVVRLSGATGEVVWQSPSVMEQFSNTSPAVGAGLVVVGANGGRLLRVRRGDRGRCAGTTSPTASSTWRRR